jgi:hypothetical protein
MSLFSYNIKLVKYQKVKILLTAWQRGGQVTADADDLPLRTTKHLYIYI